MTYKIHLIRHGMTDGNLLGLYIGRTDLPLCEEGREKLLALQETCGYPEVQKVYTSPLLRCVETAELLYPDVLTEWVDDLTEYDFGDFDGRPIGELKNDPLFNEWVAGGLKTPPGGESSESMEERVCDGLEQIFADMMRQKINSAAVITHGGVIATLLAKYGRPPRDSMFEWMVEDGCGYTIHMTSQMWMRDECFEVYDKLPYRVDAFLRLGAAEFQKQLALWEQAHQEEQDGTEP